MDRSQSSIDRLEPLWRLWPYAMRYRALVATAFVSLVLASAATLSLPVFVRGLVDQGLTEDNLARVDHYTIWLIAVVAILALASGCRLFFVITLGERVVSDLREDVFAKLTLLSPQYYDRVRSGEIVSRLTADANQIKSAVGATASMALRNLVLFIGAGAMMVVTSPQMSLMVLAGLPFIVLPLVALGRWVRRRQRYALDRLADSSAMATEAVGSMRVLQAFTQEGHMRANFSRTVEEAFRASQNLVLARSVFTSFAMFFIFTSIIGVLWYAAQDVSMGHLSAGALSQFIIYSTMAAVGLGGLSEVWGEISQASGSAERLFELLDEHVDISTVENPVALPRNGALSVDFVDVGFAYPQDKATNILTDLSFSINAGETVAIVGPSGAGKSTLFRLLMRFYDSDEGQIMLGGKDIAGAGLSDLRGAMALVPQEPYIFALSIADNIAMGREGASREEVVAAAKAAHADSFIEALPDAYDTVVGERGITLSGGQCQRLAIARAILKDAPILLLDEATSSLDAESERLVQSALDDMMVGRTTIVIAHRLATVKKADRILVMEAGRLVEEGSHHELVKKEGLYAHLAGLQFGSDAGL